MNGSSRHLGRVQSALTVASVLLGARLLVPAAVLAFSRRAADEHNATGLPPWSRLALAPPEMLGAILFVFPRTLLLGTCILVLDISGAIAAHLSLGQKPGLLVVFLAAVRLLARVQVHLSSCELRK